MILKLKQTPGIYLVGFMGSGKTTIGRLLAQQLGWHFVDIDDDIEARQKISIAAIFDSLGEAAFRKIETEAIRGRVRAISCGRPSVVSLGGGAYVQPENVQLLESHGVTIWLDCPFLTIRGRLEGARHRPLARDPQKLEELFHARREAYAAADYHIRIDGDDPEAAVEAILSLPLF